MKPNVQAAAICGLFCGTCPSYGGECGGCLSDKLTPYCAECPAGFRGCAKEHGVVRCYECGEFPCGRLEHFRGQHYKNGIGHHEEIINDLSYMKAYGVEAWLQKQIKDNACPACGKLIFWHEKKCHSC